MTKDDLYYLVQIKKNLEFTFNGKTYQLFYDTNSKGEDVIKFGVLYEPLTYNSYGEFYNNARVENHFFKDMLEDIERW